MSALDPEYDHIWAEYQEASRAKGRYGVPRGYFDDPAQAMQLAIDLLAAVPMPEMMNPMPPREGLDVGMGAYKEAEARFLLACDAWIATRQPLIANAAAHKKREAEEREARFQVANAAIHLAWHIRARARPERLLTPEMPTKED